MGCGGSPWGFRTLYTVSCGWHVSFRRVRSEALAWGGYMLEQQTCGLCISAGVQGNRIGAQARQMLWRR